MIGLRYNNEFFDLYDNTSISIQAKNPMFGGDYIPGTRVDQFRLPLSPKNKKLIGMVHRLDSGSRTSSGIYPTLPGTGLHLGKGLQLWRLGKLKVRNATRDDCTVSFHTDAGDIAAAIADKKLSDIDLGSASVSFAPELSYPDVKYTFFPVKNDTFYGDTNPDYQGYVNYYYDGAFATNSSNNNHTLVPFPFLLYILERLFQQLGYYGITGSWTQDEDIRRLVIYNTVAIDRITNIINRYSSQIKFADHMPDMEVGKFLVAIQNLFGLAFLINPITKYVEITPLKEILTTSATKDITRLCALNYEKGDYYENGFLLSMQADNGDELFKDLGSRSSERWPYSYRIQEGANTIPTAAGTLFETQHQDTINTSRTWRIPEARQTGNSSAFGLEGNGFTLRLLFYRGLTTDSAGNAYPLGSSESTNYSLRYDTGKGLYVKFWQEWLEFLGSTVEVETSINLPLKDIIAFNWKEKAMRQYIRYFYKEMNLSVSLKNGIQPARATLYRV